MKISVLMPVYNRQKYIKEAISSILNQTYKDIQLLIYDDGSTDNTIQIIESIKSNRIKLIKGLENKGVAFARNQLILNCTTKYACWMDSDDISIENRIERQIEQIKDDTIVFCQWVWLKQVNGLWKKEEMPHSSFAFATAMFPVNKMILFKENMKIGGEDWDWLEKMTAIYTNTVLIKEILYLVRYHSDRIGHWKKKIRAKIPPKIIRKLSYKELIEYYKRNYE